MPEQEEKNADQAARELMECMSEVRRRRVAEKMEKIEKGKRR